MKVTIQERGWPGHFCGANRCTYRRNTLISLGEKRIIVSSVGLFVVDNKIQEIGLNNWYETMAFNAIKNGPYYDAETRNPLDIPVSLPQGIWAKRLKDFPKNVDNIMDKRHDDIVDYFKNLLLTGGKE